MYQYNGLLQLLKQNHLNKSDLTKVLHISSRTIAKISKGEKLSPRVIRKLCDYFDCAEETLYSVVPNNPILRQLREEKDVGISGGIYHELQIRMTYNSNHMEGSCLNEEQTRHIFETNTLFSHDAVSVDDIIETVNHFRAMDYCIEIAEEALTEETIKYLHYLLKSRTKDETLSWFKVGEYKTRPNVVGGIGTSSPNNVANDIQQLLKKYHEKKQITFEDIVEFHFQFEKIHLFQDGNGRVGRLIAFKECLKHSLIPFIIEDKKKFYYYRGLKEFLDNTNYLIDTCYDGQDTMKRLLEYFQVELPIEP
ncbi:Fic family protein [uncultured Granulicatella sp.]|uniref:Fic family protein n=1 Tax=uncultured Granulicatella sp. TaxID=316089 RepID=UPI0028D5F0A4|nr:Fic family protein [uncultured Granulicatella sp.]